MPRLIPYPGFWWILGLKLVNYCSVFKIPFFLYKSGQIPIVLLKNPCFFHSQTTTVVDLHLNPMFADVLHHSTLHPYIVKKNITVNPRFAWFKSHKNMAFFLLTCKFTLRAPAGSSAEKHSVSHCKPLKPLKPAPASWSRWMVFGGKITGKPGILTMKYGGSLSIFPTKPIQWMILFVYSWEHGVYTGIICFFKIYIYNIPCREYSIDIMNLMIYHWYAIHGLICGLGYQWIQWVGLGKSSPDL